MKKREVFVALAGVCVGITAYKKNKQIKQKKAKCWQSNRGIDGCYSVLMSVYKNDDSGNLKIAIESMLDQSKKPEQFVIVEDGPISEECERIILEFKNNNPSIFTILRLKKNGGLGNALNHGIKVCRNELIARMDADDFSLPDRCEKQVERFVKDNRLCFLGGQINEFIDDPENVVSSRIVPCSYNSIKRFSRRRSPFNHPTVMFRKSALEALGGYRTYGRKEDLDLFVRAVNLGFYSENIDEVLLLYRTGKDNLKRRKTWLNCKESIQVMWGFYLNGYCGVIDLAYVVFGQLAMYLMPMSITTKLNELFLRKKAR